MGPWGPKSGQNRLKIAFLQDKSAQSAYFGLEGVKHCWNTTGYFFLVKLCKVWPGAPTMQKKEAQTGPTIIKYAKLARIPYFLWNGLKLGWNGIKDIQADHFGSFARPRMSQIWPKGAKLFPNRLNITLWQHKLTRMAYVGVDKKPKMVCRVAHYCVPTLFNTFQPKIGPLSQSVWPEGNFSLFGPLFGPLGALIGIFWVWQISQTGQPGFPQSRSSLVPALFY